MISIHEFMWYNNGVEANRYTTHGTALNHGTCWKFGRGRVKNKRKRKRYGNENIYVDIVIGDKTRGTNMSEMGGYDVSANISVTSDIKYGRTPRK